MYTTYASRDAALKKHASEPSDKVVHS